MNRPVVAAKRKRVFEPWDILRGRDVFAQRDLLLKESDSADLSHWAPNCSSFSRASPIPGVRFPPKPLRSVTCPEGIPEVLSRLNPSKRRKLDDDTAMAKLSAERCIKAHTQGRSFSLEHPLNSLARNLPSWKHLESLQGVHVTPYHACMFDGGERRKAQVLIHNSVALGNAIGKVCLDPQRCSRTGKPHKSWKPKVSRGQVVSFTTGEEREYPEGFCSAYVAGVQQSFKQSNSGFTFLEVFSGPNAPLSQAVGRLVGEKVDGLDSLSKHSKGIKTEFTSMDDLKDGATITREPSPQKVVETDQYRLAAVESGRQPSYGKRLQLIPDGLNSPSLHMEAAKKLQHPFDGEQSLKPGHVKTVDSLRSGQDTLVRRRLKTLAWLKSKAKEFEHAQAKANSKAAWTAIKLGTKVKTELTSCLQDLLSIEDREVPTACIEGLRILGRASESPFFTPFEVRPTLSWKTFIATLESRSKEMIRRVESMGRSASRDLSKAIWTKTLKEVSGGTMGPPLTLDEVKKTYGSDFQVVPSFGLQQGHGEDGAPKYRRIDDHSASGGNQVAHRLQKVPMAMADYVGVLTRAVGKLGTGVKFSTEDMKGAYIGRSLFIHLMLGTPSQPSITRTTTWPTSSRCMASPLGPVTVSPTSGECLNGLLAAARGSLTPPWTTSLTTSSWWSLRTPLRQHVFASRSSSPFLAFRLTRINHSHHHRSVPFSELSLPLKQFNQRGSFLLLPSPPESRT